MRILGFIYFNEEGRKEETSHQKNLYLINIYRWSVFEEARVKLLMRSEVDIKFFFSNSFMSFLLCVENVTIF